ncbi:type II toxin-antitoxin system CcdA family antitoxin [Oricola nitratireducens]|jgi:antitoxin CcdA|uniref:type II toxin-antitoxin system CcdA family antitoxin n=1 Tax=Oricola nitratireducens TaxID=2775868 RepID=UPI00186705A4|nr:type II toxin-antitoxin system CcdA family antitoxin [Oricola nitratireducens]
MTATSSSRRKATNLSVPADLLAEAKALDINVSRAAETGIAQAIADEKARRWREENAKAIEAANAFVDANGLPLARYRQF